MSARSGLCSPRFAGARRTFDSRALALAAALAAATFGQACTDEEPGPGDRPGYGNEPAPAAAAPVGAPHAPTCKEAQRKYAGFGGAELTQTRLETEVGLERARVKPFSALADEYKRVIGVVPASLARSGSTFGEPSPRWYAEPKASGVSMYTAYRIGFDACLAITSDPKNAQRFGAMPDAQSAPRECAAWARVAWSRTATPEEIDACAKFATGTDSATEPTATTAPVTTSQRRWAYTCASILTAASFLTY